MTVGSNLVGWLLTPGRRVVTALAVARWFEGHGEPGRKVGLVVRYRLARVWGVYVHQTATVGRVSFPHPTGIVIGAGAVVEDEVVIYQHVTLGARSTGRTAYPTIRRGAVLYAGASVLGGVEVGADAVVAAGAVVLADVGPGTSVAGVPAVAVRGG